jgi:hypothetical protein
MIPKRDLTDRDLEKLSLERGQSVDEIINELTEKSNSIYVRSDEYYCNQPGCNKKFRTWAALNKHELKHIEQLTKPAKADSKKEDR